MNKIYVFFLLILMAVACKDAFIQPTSSCVGDTSFTINTSHPKADLIQDKLDEYVAIGLPGATALIADSNGIYITSSGYADLENEVLMEPCHINKLGSVTKMMIGSLLWTFIQEGKIELSDAMSLYIPDVANRIENGNEITVAMLVNHSSGIADIASNLHFNLAVVNDFTRSWTSDEILQFIEDSEPTNQPGEAVYYSNTNTMLIGMILDKIGGKPHAELLQERIFNPLKMTNTYYYNYGQPFPESRLAQGYLDFNNNGGSIQNISDLNPGSGNGYTGVYSTVTDLYKFMKALLIDKSVISESNLNTILADMKMAQSGEWKSSNAGIHDEYIVFFAGNYQALGHAGGDIGYTANLNFFPHNNTIVAATYNYGTNLPSKLGDDLNKMRRELLLIGAE